MKKYFDDIDSKYDKKYIEYSNSNVLEEYIVLKKIDQIRFFNPIEKELIKLVQTSKLLNSIENLVFPTPYFLNSTNFNINKEINSGLTSLRHIEFYKSQRIKYNIMIKKTKNGVEPDGSKWSFDTENRKPFEKSQSEPELLVFKSANRKQYINEAFEYVEKHFSKHYGILENKNFIYPIDRTESIQWLKHFIKTKLDKFGKFEDAISSTIKFGFHSLLSGLLNVGLITPHDVIFHVKDWNLNLASKEGFIRQLIGWREYCYFTYDLYSSTLKTTSMYKLNNKKIPKKVWNCSTQIPIIDEILKNVTITSYSHHIERLMGIGNFLILIGVSIEEIYLWFHTMYWDGYAVFMIPNVYGMLSYGMLTNKSHMMTKPYLCSSNYLIKMSDYKSKECVEINGIKYRWDVIYDSLYYSHINKYMNIFETIYSTAPSAKRWKNFPSNKKKDLLELGQIYINWIFL